MTEFNLKCPLVITKPFLQKKEYLPLSSHIHCMTKWIIETTSFWLKWKLQLFCPDEQKMFNSHHRVLIFSREFKQIALNYILKIHIEWDIKTVLSEIMDPSRVIRAKTIFIHFIICKWNSTNNNTLKNIKIEYCEISEQK